MRKHQDLNDEKLWKLPSCLQNLDMYLMSYYGWLSVKFDNIFVSYP